MAKGKDVNVSITGASATTGAGGVGGVNTWGNKPPAEIGVGRVLALVMDSACAEMGAKAYTNTVVIPFSLPPANLRIIEDLLKANKQLAELPPGERDERDKLVQESLSLHKEAAQRKVRRQGTKRAREVQLEKAPTRFAAVVKEVEHLCKARRRPLSASRTSARDIRVKVEAALRKNGTIKGKRGLGVNTLKAAIGVVQKRQK